MKIKVLNGFAGLGGNRKKWEGCQVTAIEKNEHIARAYKDFFPDDEVIVGDAVEYLLKNYAQFHFIWLSPECVTHSDMRRAAVVRGRYPAVLPDLSLYQLIIFLKHYFRGGKWVVENVVPYYDPLIKPMIELDRHLFWTNFKVPGTAEITQRRKKIHNYLKGSDTIYGFNIKKYRAIKDKRKIMRNLINPDIGNHLFQSAMRGFSEAKQQNFLDDIGPGYAGVIFND